jgi:hypothetical protein
LFCTDFNMSKRETAQDDFWPNDIYEYLWKLRLFIYTVRRIVR